MDICSRYTFLTIISMTWISFRWIQNLFFYTRWFSWIPQYINSFPNQSRNCILYFVVYLRSTFTFTLLFFLYIGKKIDCNSYRNKQDWNIICYEFAMSNEKKSKLHILWQERDKTFGKREAIYIPYKIIQNFTFVHDLNFLCRLNYHVHFRCR